VVGVPGRWHFSAMARKLRLEFPGAIYHVINRGNYRGFVFRSSATRQAFEECLFQACERSQWLLHAFVIMGNHYHLAVETPHGNLAAGMQWFQATFANRFNRLRGERGHLFQGRYKSLLVEEGERLGTLCHYIHLNPARAHLVPIARLEGYRHSSYWYLQQPRQRPDFLRAETALIAAGQLTDTPAGRRCYAEYLVWQMASGPAGKSTAYASMSRGWALGSKEFKRALLRDHSVAEETRAWEKSGARQVREEKWRMALEESLAHVPPEAQADQRGAAPWKVAVAVKMKTTTDADNHWLAQQLKIGSPRYLAKLVSYASRT
jgi:REP element-mobilizing transposase RayT